MPKTIRIRKGLDIKLLGEASKTVAEKATKYFALKPTDFRGIIPKLDVQEGDRVKAGSVLFHDKNNERLVFTSPVSGSVVQILRGAKRVIQEICIEHEGEMEYEDFGIADPSQLAREEVIDKLTGSGIWPVIRQRPYTVIANLLQPPKSIFISGFDTAPLAPDSEFVLRDSRMECQTGINALTMLTDGKVYLCLKHGTGQSMDFNPGPKVEVVYFSGPHPSGNVSVQIHHLDPINKGETVWYVHIQDLALIGRLFLTGHYDAACLVALTGSEIIHPQYYKTFRGARISEMLEGNVRTGNVRYLSGNVLTGSRIDRTGYLGYYDHHITVLPEGNHHEFLGWAKPGF
ncbi:MAG: NADH:ubiquinone reductase (Na(+)-transporting) subunit A, partial [Bacteroidales bacterium]|nr:NADH:ubiquinone reductase (Na(+)-transporting) subunit A [Bacteroidales bacterium]